MNNKIGVMQGRLLPKYQGRYQAHPKGYWQKEYEIAKALDLDCIEFILDFNDAELNPLLRSGGIEEILEISKTSGITTKTICADYFMQAPIHSMNESVATKSLNILSRLLHSSSKLEVTDIVIPCVDQSSLNNKKSIERFVLKMQTILSVAEDYNINISLETDLAPVPFVELLERLNSKNVTVNYDIGNSAALGYNSVEELDAYGCRISDIHIKDRVFGGGTVVLGNGHADFPLFFNKLSEFNYNGPFIMQAYRDDDGVGIFKNQLDWISQYIQPDKSL